jgi:hypothetical protein
MNGFASRGWFFSKSGRGAAVIGLLGWCLILALGMGTAGSVSAAQPPGNAPPSPKKPLNQAMAEIAKQIQMFLEKEKKTVPNLTLEVAVNNFNPAARLVATATPAVRLALCDELKALDIAVKKQAALEVMGEYRDGNDQQKGGKVLVITATVVDAESRKSRLDLNTTVSDPTTMATIFGLTVQDPTPDASKPQVAAGTDLSTNIGRAIGGASDAQPHVVNTRVSAGQASPYFVEILAVRGKKGELAPCPVDIREGLPFVKLFIDDIYAVNIINDSQFDASVTLSIDGLNTFQFSQIKGYDHWIVPKKGSLTINGWHLNNEKSDLFKVAPLAAGAVAMANGLTSLSEIGTITATFAVAWSPEEPVPSDEQPSRGEADAAIATAVGPEANVKYDEVRRHVGRFRSSVSIRYDKTIPPTDLPPESKPEPAGKVAAKP